MMNSKYMRYSADIDRNFIDRPHQVIRHCMLKKSIGEKMDQTGIRMTDVGKFTIQHFKNNMKKYIISTLVATIKYLVVRAIHGKNLLIHVSIFLQFFRNLLFGVGMSFQDCIKTQPTLIWMILIAPSKQKISYKITALS